MFQGLREVCDDTALSYRTVALWVKAFWEDRDAVEYNLRSVQLLASLLDADRRWTECELAAELGVCH